MSNTDTPKKQEDLNNQDGIILSPEQARKALHSENFSELREAVERLYIFHNMSGRLLFEKKWPLLATHIFGTELMSFDHNGAITKEDKIKREELCETAEERRLELVDSFEYMDKELIKDGSVNLDKLEFIMQKFSRDICLILFAEKFVNRFHSVKIEPIVTEPSESKAETETESEQPPVPEQKAHISNPLEEEALLSDLPTGKVNLPPPAARPMDFAQEFQSMKSSAQTPKTGQSNITEHIGHADHSLSQTLTPNQHQETDIFAPEYKDPMDDIQPIHTQRIVIAEPTLAPQEDSLKNTPAEQVPSSPLPAEQPAQQIAVEEPPAVIPEQTTHAPTESQHQPSEPTHIAENTEQPPVPEPTAIPESAPVPKAPPYTEPLQTNPDSPIKPVAPKPRLGDEEKQHNSGPGWQPTPPQIDPNAQPYEPTEEDDDKPLFIANYEAEQRGLNEEKQTQETEQKNNKPEEHKEAPFPEEPPYPEEYDPSKNQD